MEEIFRKKLTKSEIKVRLLRVPSKAVDLLPKKTFKVTIGGVEQIKKIDKYDRISVNVKDLAKAGDTIIFSKKPDGSYLISFES